MHIMGHNSSMLDLTEIEQAMMPVKPFSSSVWHFLQVQLSVLQQ